MKSLLEALGNTDPTTQPYHPQALLGEVMIDVGSFHGKVAWRIQGVALFLWWFIGCFTHGQEVWKENQTQVVALGE